VGSLTLILFDLSQYSRIAGAVKYYEVKEFGSSLNLFGSGLSGLGE
jgi:hypothetical protein